ncbi:GNAT family N-acetyltransferase [Aeromonas veronii]|uniref:GNAT family N-acetyltransferase n=1 Tax=Aeromonas veronii TaxID=654 RepID=UPI0035BB87A2
MSEALGLLFAHASTLGVTRLTADIDADNVRSIALFEKLGFQAHAGGYKRPPPFI